LVLGEVLAGVVKIRFIFGAKVDPVFVPTKKNNSLGFGFHFKIQYSQFLIHNFHHPRF